MLNETVKIGNKELKIFCVQDTTMSPRHPASDVHGHPGRDYMCIMNWETCSFMQVRQVPTLEGHFLGAGGGGDSLLLYMLCSGVCRQGS